MTSTSIPLKRKGVRAQAIILTRGLFPRFSRLPALATAGSHLGLKAFAIAIVGGLDSISGTLVAGGLPAGG